MTQKLKNILKGGLSLALAVTLLFFSFRGVDWKEFWSCLGSTNWTWVAVSMAVGLAAIYFRGLRWRELLLPVDPETTRLNTYDANAIGSLVNIVLPRIGEFIRCGYITLNSSLDGEGHRKAGVDKVLGTAIVDRLWDMVCLVLCVFIVSFLMVERFGSFFANLFKGATISIPYLLLVAVGVVAILVFLTWKFQDRSSLLARIWKAVGGVWQGVSSCMRMRTWWKFILYTLAVWGCYWLMSCCIVWAFQDMDPTGVSAQMAYSLEKISSLDIYDALFLMVAGAISSVVPVPGGFGAFHYVVSLALSSMYGIPTELGVIFATLSHESQIIMQIVAGGVSWIRQSLRKRGNGEIGSATDLG